MKEEKRMQLVNIDYIPGKEIEALGLVKGTVVYSKNFGKDFMAGMKEYERMEREGSMEAKDYYGRTWLYGRMIGVCQREIMKDYDKTMELSKENDPELYNQAKYGKVVYRVDCSGEGQQCIDELLQAVKDNPEDVTEWVCLETAYYWAKRYEECYQVAKEAIAKFPEESDRN